MDNLVPHSETHTGQYILDCTICHKTIVGMDNLVDHSKTHTNKEFTSVIDATEQLWVRII